MSTSEATAKSPHGDEMVIGRVGSAFVRYASKAAVPVDVAAISEEVLTSMTKEELEDLYSSLAGVPIKKFKTPKVALENVAYQISKMPVRDSMVLATQSQPASTVRKYERKSPNKYILLVGPDTEKALRDMAPQARECVSIMGDFAKELGRLEFDEEELRERFEASRDRLSTKQSPWRILQYYRAKLISSNLMRVS